MAGSYDSLKFLFKTSMQSLMFIQEGIESQAVDRVNRIGQKKPVHVYQLIAENTVESKVGNDRTTFECSTKLPPGYRHPEPQETAHPTSAYLHVFTTSAANTS